MQERFMQLQFHSTIQELDEQRVIATLLGCIKRRMQQKGVEWENAKEVPLRYNDEAASISWATTYKSQAGLAEDPGDEYEKRREWGIERHLRKGDRGILITRARIIAKVQVAHWAQFHEYFRNEHIKGREIAAFGYATFDQAESNILALGHGCK
ncbi:hypothetical protein B296_00043972 [Ensete ventricosum]|uniref:Uncharacterized protein n=1 Tax=Ensete ventricosum TaxID=4639 RepID=A0A426YSD4_ENSVE|nr:hypothetical protein B296_00043972 [Ensete ventricosum]